MAEVKPKSSIGIPATPKDLRPPGSKEVKPENAQSSDNQVIGVPDTTGYISSYLEKNEQAKGLGSVSKSTRRAVLNSPQEEGNNFLKFESVSGFLGAYGSQVDSESFLTKIPLLIQVKDAKECTKLLNFLKTGNEKKVHIAALKFLHFNNAALSVLTILPKLEELILEGPMSWAIPGCALTSTQLCTLFSEIDLPSLKTLILSRNKLSEENLKLLSSESNMPSLKDLGLRDCDIGPAGLKLIASSERFPSLERLSLSENQIGDAGVRLLTESKNYQNLKSLLLSDCGISIDGALNLAYSQNLPSLIYLNLMINPINYDVVPLLEKSPALQSCVIDFGNVPRGYRRINRKLQGTGKIFSPY